MSLEVIYEEEICKGELKVILYENFQFKFTGRNYGIRPFDKYLNMFNL